MEEIQVDLDKVGGIETQSVDLSKFDKKEIEIESAIVSRVHSNYVDTPEKLQYVLKVSSKVVTSAGEGEEKVDFRASELFNLVQDEKGVLQGFPKGEGSNLMRFLKDLHVENPEKLKTLKEVIASIVGKKTLIKTQEKIKEGKKQIFLRFRY